VKITQVESLDIRFPTSDSLDGSDAMNPDPDYSAAYVILHTDHDLAGHGFASTIGRGNEVCVAAIEALAPLVTGRDTGDVFSDLGGFSRVLTGDSQLRWIGPEKGAIHLATAAIVNAMWDLYAKAEQKPLWKLLVDLSPEQLVSCVDFRYLSDALTPEEAVDILSVRERGRADREAEMMAEGFPAYTTSVGWLGYTDEKLRQRTQEASAAGWTRFKMKVGADLADDRRRAALLREVIGDGKLMMDANQVWDIREAIAAIQQLAEFEPHWFEEPTSPDDVLGHATIASAISPIRVATGEHVHNRVMFKQLFQANAIGFCQLDACRLGGVNEVLAVLLLAAKFAVPVCPHAGGVGLCEYVQHISFFDYIRVGSDLTDRMLEYVDHLHEHFVDPVVIRDARYVPPAAAGYSATMSSETLEAYRFPTGSAWLGR
jgi:L-fuconate dehydratase